MEFVPSPNRKINVRFEVSTAVTMMIIIRKINVSYASNSEWSETRRRFIVITAFLYCKPLGRDKRDRTVTNRMENVSFCLVYAASDVYWLLIKIRERKTQKLSETLVRRIV
jgi:hypothetical protein